jgi:hypothetical protein
MTLSSAIAIPLVKKVRVKPIAAIVFIAIALSLLPWISGGQPLLPISGLYEGANSGGGAISECRLSLFDVVGYQVPTALVRDSPETQFYLPC